MSLDNNNIVKAATINLIGQLKILNKVTNGLSDTVIGTTITSTGTVAKLKSAIAGLTLRTQDKHYADNIVATINRCKRYGTLTDADVETARAAATFAALLTAITAHTQSPSSSTGLQAHAVWAQ